MKLLRIIGISTLLLFVLVSCAHHSPMPEPAAHTTFPDSGSSEPGMLRIGWRLQSQENVYGFNVYRAESEDGPWKKANDDIIPGHDTTSTPHTYEFFDTGLTIGKKYYYYIEEVTFDGQQNRISPVQSAVAKHRDHYKKKQK